MTTDGIYVVRVYSNTNSSKRKFSREIPLMILISAKYLLLHWTGSTVVSQVTLVPVHRSLGQLRKCHGWSPTRTSIQEWFWRMGDYPSFVKHSPSLWQRGERFPSDKRNERFLFLVLEPSKITSGKFKHSIDIFWDPQKKKKPRFFSRYLVREFGPISNQLDSWLTTSVFRKTGRTPVRIDGVEIHDTDNLFRQPRSQYVPHTHTSHGTLTLKD